MITCGLCGQNFSTVQLLAAHIKNVHSRIGGLKCLFRIGC